MKNETSGAAIKEFFRLKYCIHPRMYSFLVDDNSEHKKAKGVNKNFAKNRTHNEYKI